MIELEDFLNWLTKQHPEASDVIIATTGEYIGEICGYEQIPIIIDYGAIQKKLPPTQWGLFQDLWDEYCKEWPLG